MAEYDIADIALNITATSDNATKSIEKLTSSLQNLNTAFSKVGKSSISTKGIERIGNFFETLNNIKLSGDVYSAFNSQTNVIDNIATSMGNLKVAEVGARAKELNSLTNTMNKLSGINLSSLSGTMEQINKIAFGEGFKQAFGENGDVFSSFNKFANALPKLNELNLNADNIKTQFEQLANAVDPFLQKIKEAQPALEAFNNSVDLSRIQSELDKLNNKLDKTKETTINIKNTLKNWLNHLYAAVNYSKRFVRALVSVVQNAIDYNETLNKFQLAMRGNYEDAIGFVNRITYAFNLSSESIMNYQATFKNMLANLGNLTDSVSSNLSALMTEFAIDFSSLYNVSIERSMNIFQSALSSQIRAIRSVSGFDITEKTLYDVYERMGGTKAMRGLSQLEKRLLIIATLQEQMAKATATGDYQRTINEAASVLRQIQQSAKEATIWIGKFLLQTLEPFLRKVLSIVLVIRDMAKAFVVSQPGYEEKDFIGRLEEGANNATSAIEETEDAVNSLKRTTLGFDQLNILGSSTSNTEEVDDIQMILDHIQGSNDALAKSFESVGSEARKMADTILSKLGYVFDEDSQMWTITENTKTLSDILKQIGTTLSIIIGLVASAKIVKLIGSIPKIVEGVKGIGTAMSGALQGLSSLTGIATGPLGAIIALIGVIIGGFTKLMATNEEFRNNMKETFSSIVEAFKRTGIDKLFSYVIKSLGYILTQLGYLLGMLFNIFDLVVSIGSFNFKNVGEAWNRLGQTFKGWMGSYIAPFSDAISGDFRFAKGGVITKPTIGLMGEYSGASHNPEIVTPENKMREVFAESMLPLVQAIMAGNKEVVRAVDDLSDRPIELNGRKVSENIFNDLNSVARRRGYKGFA